MLVVNWFVIIRLDNCINPFTPIPPLGCYDVPTLKGYNLRTTKRIELLRLGFSDDILSRLGVF